MHLNPGAYCGARHNDKEIPVKDLQAHLAQVRSDAAECLVLGTLATDKKSEMFVKMAEHLNGLAFEIEKTIAANGASPAPAAPQPEATVKRSAAADHRDAVAADAGATEHQGTATAKVAAPVRKTKRSRRIIAGLLIVAAIAGPLVWTTGYADWAEKQVEGFLSPSIEQPKREPSALSDGTKQAITALMSTEQSERKAISEQLKALGSRIDHLEGELDKLKNAPAQTMGQANKLPSEDVKPPSAPQPSPPASEESRSSRDGDQTFTVQNPTKRPDSNSPTGPVGQTATTAAPGGELAGRKPGPLGCEHFRSYDAVSGTYVTFDGRRRPCR